MAMPGAEPDWQGALAAIEAAQSILLVAHVSPDGDAVGSLLGMAGALRERGKNTNAAIDGGVPKELAFIPRSDSVLPALSTGEFDLFITLDSSDIERLGKVGAYGFSHSRRVINLDHHPTNTGFGDIHLVLPNAVAAAEVVFDFLTHANWRISRDAATALLAGLVTDTQGFRVPGTNSRTLEIAQALMGHGADLPDIMARAMNRRSYGEVVLWQRALQSAQLEDGLISANITQSDLAQAGLHTMTDGGLVNHLVDVDEAKVAVVFKELRGEVEVSFRAKPGFDVGRMAFALGGGGHTLAAGCTLKGALQLVRDKALPLARQVIRDGKTA